MEERKNPMFSTTYCVSKALVKQKKGNAFAAKGMNL